jgi:hypothetical protein
VGIADYPPLRKESIHHLCDYPLRGPDALLHLVVRVAQLLLLVFVKHLKLITL